MRLSGGILVLTCVMLLGAEVSHRLKKRREFLEETVAFFTSAEIEIGYANLPVFEILNNIRKAGNCRSLDYIALCIAEMEKGESLSLSWSRGIETSSLPFRKDEKEKLTALGFVLGTSDSVGQRTILALYKEYFISFADKAREEYEKYGKMCVTVSTVIGVGIFIILL